MDENTNIANNTILEALSLNPTSSNDDGNKEEILFCCMFCEHTEKANVGGENKAILQHIFMQHRVVIADVNDITELMEYLQFWKIEFKG